MNLTKDVVLGTPVASAYNLDICNFAVGTSNYLCAVHYNDTFKYFNGTTWTSVYLVAGTFAQHIGVFENKRSLCIADTYKVQLVDSSLAVPAGLALSLPPNYSITGMAWNNNRMYFSTLNTNTENTLIFEWDGSSSEANIGYDAGGQQAWGITRYKDGCVCVNSLGEVLYINGGVKRLAQFPVFSDKKQWTMNDNLGQGFAPINPNGITVDEDKIYFSVDSFYFSDFNDEKSDWFENNFPSGIWCYDPKVGLHHKYSVDGARSIRTGAITTANIDVSTNIITIPSSICPDTGTPVFYDDGGKGVGTRATPLETKTRYFVIKVSGTTLKLATTRTNALAGTAIDITGTGNNVQTLIFSANNGFGGIAEKTKCLSLIETTSSGRIGMPDTFSSKLFVGSNVFTNANAVFMSIGSVVDGQENRAYEITPRIQSQGIKDVWQKLYLKFNPLVNEDDKIIVKYRTTKPKRLLRRNYRNSVGGTWVNSTSFTTTESRFSEVVVGDELEIIKGAGAGYLAHITVISLNAGTYTVTIDETVQNIAANDTFSFTVDNWIKLKVIDTDYKENTDGFAEITLGEKKTKWIQFKIELRGIDVTIEEFQLINEAFKKSE
jgi:hypothetical protein